MGLVRTRAAWRGEGAAFAHRQPRWRRLRLPGRLGLGGRPCWAASGSGAMVKGRLRRHEFALCSRAATPAASLLNPRSSRPHFAPALRFDDRTWYPLGRVIGGTVYPVSRRGSCQAARQRARSCRGTKSPRRVEHSCRTGLRPHAACQPPAAPSLLPGIALPLARRCQPAALSAPANPSPRRADPPQGLIVTAGAMYRILHALNIPIHVQEVRHTSVTCAPWHTYNTARARPAPAVRAL